MTINLENTPIANVYLAKWRKRIEIPKRITDYDLQIWGPTDIKTASQYTMEAIKHGEKVAMAVNDFEVPVFQLIVNIGFPKEIYHWV